MIELNRNQPSAHVRTDLQDLQQRATRRRDRFRLAFRSSERLRFLGSASLSSPGTWFTRLPARFLSHTVVALLVPIALLLSQLPTAPVLPSAQPDLTQTDPLLLGIGPIVLSDTALTTVGDPPLDEDEALPVPISLDSRSEMLAPLTVVATISGDLVKLRNGPGLAYDDIGRITGGSNIEVLARYGEWLQVRQTNDPATYWVAAELVDLPESVIFTLTQISDEQIPPPPPPKVGIVRESGLNLRDGPGTNYVRMTALDAGAELGLVEQYQDWLLVNVGETYGWVKAEFLSIGPDILTRVPTASSIPDPNPALVGLVLENAVNLRKGPGSAYARLGSVQADTRVDLLARHKDWFRVQLGDGTKAWVFSDLLQISPMAARRVPYTNDIPALPVRTRAAVASGGPINAPVSGDVAGFAVQFVGYRYVWGGSSPGRGFDCSGLTSYVYRQFGVGLPHSAAGQYSTRYGAMVGSMGNLAPGDLMFFAGTGGRRGISHVAIYIGGGQMVHAMTPSYGVQISGIWSAYWQNHYVGAIRPYR